MTLEINLISYLFRLKPRQAAAVGLEAGDDVVLAVAVDVVDEHLGPAVAVAGGEELLGVELPVGVAGEAGGLLPPAAGLQKVHLSVAVDVAVAQAVGEALEMLVARAGLVEGPLGIRVVGIGLGPAELAVGVENQFLPAVAGEVAVGGGL